MLSRMAALDGFELEYRLAPRMAVFSHGFGVRRDSRGLFRDITAAFSTSIGYVLFDYDQPSGEQLRATSAAEQVARLKRAIAWVAQQPGVEDIGLVAHSRGCLIASMAKVHPLSFAVMLAPPLVQGHARQYFTHKPGVVKQGDDWYVPRSDGTTTIISEGVFNEFDHVQREELLLDYATVQPMLTVAAGADLVLGEQDYSHLEADDHITFTTISGASHDFAGPAREPLIQLVLAYIKESR